MNLLRLEQLSNSRCLRRFCGATDAPTSDSGAHPRSSFQVVTLIFLVLISALSAKAHDPYEITSIAYIHSNRMEVLVELEFPTAMKLAGIELQNEARLASQIENAQAPLRALAGGFFALTAGNHVVSATETNVILANEEHVHFQITFPPTPHRPLQFTVRGLERAGDSPYGTTLTVLDMVNQKVLGQTTLFAGTPSAEFPPRAAETAPAGLPLEIAPDDSSIPESFTAAPVTPPMDEPSPAATTPARTSRLTFLLGIGVAALAFVILAAWRNRS